MRSIELTETEIRKKDFYSLSLINIYNIKKNWGEVMAGIGFTIECRVCGKTVKRGTSFGIMHGFLCYDCYFKCQACLEKRQEPCGKCVLEEADKEKVLEY